MMGAAARFALTQALHLRTPDNEKGVRARVHQE